MKAFFNALNANIARFIALYKYCCDIVSYREMSLFAFIEQGRV